MLFLQRNNVGDAGAVALAEAVKATVLSCKECGCRRVFAVTVNVVSQGRL